MVTSRREKFLTSAKEPILADFSGDEDEAYDIIHLKSVNKMDEYIEKPTVLNHGKKDAMTSSQNGTPKVVRQDRLFSSEPKNEKKFPIHSRILIVKHRTKVFKTFQWC